MRISGIYKITNIETNECYIGSSKDIKHRWSEHKRLSTWKQKNSKLYIAFQQYGLDKFSFEIVEETDNLKEREQYYIDLLKPIYNDRRAHELDIERFKEYRQTDKCKEANKKYRKKYNNQICIYNGKKITLSTLSMRFYKAGIEHPTLEAKKYLLNL